MNAAINTLLSPSEVAINIANSNVAQTDLCAIKSGRIVTVNGRVQVNVDNLVLDTMTTILTFVNNSDRPYKTFRFYFLNREASVGGDGQVSTSGTIGIRKFSSTSGLGNIWLYINFAYISQG